MNSHVVNLELPLNFDLVETRRRLAPLLEVPKKIYNTPVPCHYEDNPYQVTFCCAHSIQLNLVLSAVIHEKSLPVLRQYAFLTAFSNTSCVDEYIQGALENIGLFIFGEDYLLWKELL
jgi:aminopeptidase N